MRKFVDPIKVEDTWQLHRRCKAAPRSSIVEYKHEYAGHGWAGINTVGTYKCFHTCEYGDKAKEMAEKYTKTKFKTSCHDNSNKGGMRVVTLPQING